MIDFEYEDISIFEAPVKNKIAVLKDQRKEVERLWQVCEDVWDNIFDTQDTGRVVPLADYRYVPLARQVARNIQNQIYSRAVSNPTTIFGIVGKTKATREREKIFEAYLKEKILTTDFKNELQKVIQDGLKYGAGVALIEFKEKTKRYRKALQDGTVIIEEAVESRTAGIRCIRPYDFYFDTAENEFCDAFKVVVSYLSESALLKAYPDCTEKLTRFFERAENAKSEAFRGFNQGVRYEKPIYKDGKILVQECYGSIKADGQWYHDMQFVMVGNEVLVKAQKNPYFTNPVHLYTVRNSDDGWGEGGILYENSGLLKGYNHFNATALGSMEYVIRPAYLVPAGTLEQDVKMKPGAFIPMNPDVLGDFKPQRIDINPDGALSVLPLLERNLQGVSGAVRQITGDVSTTDASQTATEFQGLAMAANIDMDVQIDRFNNLFKLPLVEALSHTIACYFAEEKTVEVLGKTGKKEETIYPDDFYESWDFIVTDNKSKQAEANLLQQKIQMLQLIASLPSGRNVNFEELAKQLLKDGGFAVDDLFMDDTQVIFNQLNASLQQAFLQALAQKASEQYVDLTPLVLQTMGEGVAEFQESLMKGLDDGQDDNQGMLQQNPVAPFDQLGGVSEGTPNLSALIGGLTTQNGGGASGGVYQQNDGTGMGY